DYYCCSGVDNNWVF
nr:immunoglobulin light chain junction region [Macaca mulatta]MOW28158.1 immunoglobulin light chain junction region [Macaca mulatta]MOW28348.1 immunoglobulin light chain junction region [Macaca mulatta]MOW28702.1 immunoglobulin light chain junction region [Macaca mulatta]MOW28778.1 immunoglobulin light chain junction region [Macaca mulatta]